MPPSLQVKSVAKLCLPFCSVGESPHLLPWIYSRMKHLSLDTGGLPSNNYLFLCCLPIYIKIAIFISVSVICISPLLFLYFFHSFSSLSISSDAHKCNEEMSPN